MNRKLYLWIKRILLTTVIWSIIACVIHFSPIQYENYRITVTAKGTIPPSERPSMKNTPLSSEKPSIHGIHPSNLTLVYPRSNVNNTLYSSYQHLQRNVNTDHPKDQYYNTSTKNSSIKIPHRIHQIWGSYILPDLFIPWINSWLVNHPEWEYWFWTNEEAVQLISTVPVLKEAYYKITDKTNRANLIKFIIIHTFGGVYADLDMKSLKPMDPWTTEFDCVIIEENLEHPLIYHQLRGKIMMTMFACRPGHPYFKALIDGIAPYPGMKKGKRQLYADDIYKQYRSTSGRNRTSGELHVVHDGEYFFPTFDPMLKTQLRTKCTKTYKSLSKQFQSVCDHLIATQFTNLPSSTDFTNHFWVHLDSTDPKTLKKLHVDLRNCIDADRMVNVTAKLTEIIMAPGV